MTGQDTMVRGYRVYFHGPVGKEYTVRYHPRELQHARGPNGRPKKVGRTFEATLEARADAPVIWDRVPAEDASVLATIDADARARVIVLDGWLDRLNGLIATVRDWAADLGWSTKVIEKAMEDREIGHYQAPALLLQEETTRGLLEPVARRTPKAEGAVDLYIMPAYADIAGIYYYDLKWHIHYVNPADRPAGADWEHGARPLTKAAFRKALGEMKSHAG